MQNPTPQLHQSFKLCSSQIEERRQKQLNQQVDDPIDQFQIFQMIRHINDPQYPLTLEQLGVVAYDRISIKNNNVLIMYTPTIPHCSMAQIIGLMIKVKLISNLPLTMKTKVVITPGSHVKQLDVNKQINDKQRVAAARQNPSILKIIRRGFLGSQRFQFKPI